MLSSEGDEYARFFNKKAALLGLSTTVNWDGGKYTVNDDSLPSVSYCFRHEHQGHMAYKDGLAPRALDLGKSYFLDRIDFVSGDVILDCGANVGDFYLWFLLKGIDVDYTGFEPSPVEFSCLRKNVNGKTVHNIGLWNESGELTFYVSSQGADSSLIEPRHYDEKIVVETRRLDSLITGRVKLLKLEAEGAEPEILEGIGEQLQDIEYITADLGYERGVAAESTLVPTINFLLARNFELVEVGRGRLCALFKNRRLTTG
ncbi:FkbM family methyltransferase [Roseibium sp. HPY-6]|uniref:FkbM family methyltransferase n=1 Tax=Roseibium sp. HPY-6 TaxID=3229852 RepID=UPI00338E0FF4